MAYTSQITNPGNGMTINGMPMGQTTQYNPGGPVPAAPKVDQLNAASGSFTGSGGNLSTVPGTNIPNHFSSPQQAQKVLPPGYKVVNGGASGGGAGYYYMVPDYSASSGAGSPAGAVQPGGPSVSPSGGATQFGGGIFTGTGGGGNTSSGVTSPPTSALSGGYALPTGANASITANPWSLAANSSAVNAGNVAGGQATTNLGQADNMRTGANTLQSGAGTVLNTAFDPQNALYNRTAQQLQDQVRVGEAARGITMSPYGAGVEDKAMSDFNIDWQNAQLGRQTQGLGAAGTATNSAGTANVTGANLGQQGVAQTQEQGQLPMEDYNTQQQQNIQNWIAYMNQANAATGLAQINYPLQLSQQSMTQAGGVPYIPQNSNTFNLA